MQKNYRWLFLAFTLLIATIFPFTAEASTFTYDDLPQIVKSKHSKDSSFAYGTYDGKNAVFTGQIRNSGFDHIDFVFLDGTTEWGINGVAKPNQINIKYSTYDIKYSDGSVFFSKTMHPIPKALSQVLPNLMSQAKKILPVGLVVLSALLVVSLIPKVLYRLF